MNIPDSTPTFAAMATGYFPRGYKSRAEAELEGGPTDRCDHPLYSVDDYATGSSTYVSVAMDPKVFPYRQPLHIPELDRLFGMENILFRVVDDGNDFIGTGTSRVDICCGSRDETYQIDDQKHNALPVTLIVLREEEI